MLVKFLDPPERYPIARAIAELFNQSPDFQDFLFYPYLCILSNLAWVSFH